MLYYNRIDVSEEIDISKVSTSKGCIICNYWYFLDKESRFQSYVCNDCHDLLMMSIGNNSIAVLNVHGIDYLCIIAGI